jgi:hypothetical protein
MGIFPTGSNVKRQVSYPSPVSASDRGIFRQNTTKTASLPKNSKLFLTTSNFDVAQ